MSFNSSSSDLSPLPLLNASSEHRSYFCFNYSTPIFIGASFAATKVALLLPLCALIARQALRRPGGAAASHSDVFCHHMLCVELLSVSGWSLFCGGTYSDVEPLVLPGYYLLLASFPGQMCFHCLTCAERYLAVARPVAYLSLRAAGGVKIRNLSVAAVWLLCAGWTGVVRLSYPVLPSTPLFCLAAASVAVVSSCSLSVLWVLRRPGPGDVGAARQRVDPVKRRAAATVVAIMAVLLLYFLGFVLCVALRVSALLSYGAACAATASAVWFSLPSSLLLPLLLLQRARPHGSACV